jgi:acetyltransferase-like isoleucine patch superfamily enzyme
VRHAVCLTVGRLLAWIPVPTIRARILRLLGADIGSNVRVHDLAFINLDDGFRNLHLGDDVHVGAQSLLDLADVVTIGDGAVLAPRVCVLTHQDAGSHHGAPVAEVLGTFRRPTTIGPGAFVGTGAVILAGSTIGAYAVVGAGAVVTADVPPATVVTGTPATARRSIAGELAALGVRVASE